jgi:ABC-type multidrug transport system fused ATPase/permease subunit
MYHDLMKVSRGFKLVYIGLLLVIAAVVGMILTSMLMAGALFGKINIGAGVMIFGAMGLTILLWLVGFIIGLIGRIFCLWIPAQANSAKVLIKTSIVLEILGLAMSINIQISPLLGMQLNSDLTQILAMLGGLSQLVSIVLFLLFTKEAANFIRRTDLGESALHVLWLWAGTIGCCLVGLAIMMSSILFLGRGGLGRMPGVICFGSLIYIVAFIIGLIALVRFITLMKEMNEAVARYARNHRRSKPAKSKRRVQEEEDWEVVEDEEDEDDEEEEEEDEDEDDRRRRRYRRFDRD